STDSVYKIKKRLLKSGKDNIRYGREIYTPQAGHTYAENQIYIHHKPPNASGNRLVLSASGKQPFGNQSNRFLLTFLPFSAFPFPDYLSIFR
ncbi:MAG: hypothetical protein Q4D56_13290, partial [Bacteroides sp.]|nr:hypothetical protein [Bacteroides sp.]